MLGVRGRGDWGAHSLPVPRPPGGETKAGRNPGVEGPGQAGMERGGEGQI